MLWNASVRSLESCRSTIELRPQINDLASFGLLFWWPFGGHERPSSQLCVPKTKSERIDDEVGPRWRANLWRRIAEPDGPAHPFAKTDAF
jgi:hypothetical protein